jgi:hypothetical protein
MQAVDYNQHMAKKGRGDPEPKSQPGWYVRLPYRYQHAMLAWKKEFFEETGVEPDLVSGVMKALDEFLKSKGIDPKSFPNEKPSREPEDD